MQTADCLTEGQGPAVVLLHSSVAGARQWHGVMAELKDCYSLIAPNLHGYGNSPVWAGHRRQRLADQADLVEPLLPSDPATFSIVGHSFGGLVAMALLVYLLAVLMRPERF